MGVLHLIERPVDRVLVSINETLRSVTHEAWQYSSQIANGGSVFVLGFLHKPSLHNYMKQRQRIKFIEPKTTLPGISPFATIINHKKNNANKDEENSSPEINPRRTREKKQEKQEKFLRKSDSQFSPSSAFSRNNRKNLHYTQPIARRSSAQFKRASSEPDIFSLTGDWGDIPNTLPDDIPSGVTPTGLFEDLRLLQLTIINFIMLQIRWLWHSLIGVFNGHRLFSFRTILAPFYFLLWLWTYFCLFLQLTKRIISRISKILFHPSEYLSQQGIDKRTKEEIVRDSGYPYELHTVTTEDGYIITLERLPNPTSKKVIYFQHGLIDSGFTWLASGNSTSLAMAAYDNGYDVFLGNFRGNAPTSHVNPNISSSVYWNFTINDHAFKDVPAFVKHIYDVKRRELKIPPRELQFRDHFELICVAHSMGGMAALMYIIQSRMDKKWHGLSKAILLSPAGIHVDAPPLARWGAPIIDIALKFLPFVHCLRFPSNFMRVLSAKVMEDVKSTNQTRDLFTYIATMLIGGSVEDHSLNRVNAVRWIFTGTPVNVFRHFRQLISSKSFRAYNYGKKRNLQEYGSPTPPCYYDHYDKIDIPVYYMMGLIDNLIRPANVIAHFQQHAAYHPDKAFLRAFADAGHVEFTLGVSEEMTNVILDCIRNSEDPNVAPVSFHTLHQNHAQEEEQ